MNNRSTLLTELGVFEHFTPHLPGKHKATPYVLLANRPAIEADAARLARYLELDEASFDGLLAWILLQA